MYALCFLVLTIIFVIAMGIVGPSNLALGFAFSICAMICAADSLFNAMNSK